MEGSLLVGHGCVLPRCAFGTCLVNELVGWLRMGWLHVASGYGIHPVPAAEAQYGGHAASTHWYTWHVR